MIRQSVSVWRKDHAHSQYFEKRDRTQNRNPLLLIALQALCAVRRYAFFPGKFRQMSQPR
jgi:hypothetical protein